MGYIWNIYEKSFTPYYASLAPKHLVHRHKVKEEACRLGPAWQDARTKSMLRFVRRYFLQNTKLYHFGILLFAFFWENLWKTAFRSVYLKRNYEHSLPYAEKKEQDWRKAHPELYESDEEDEEASAEEEDDE